MNREWKRKNNWEIAAVILIPAIVILLSLYRSGIYPFGDNTLVYHDMQYQYLDFFMWFHDVLHGKEALGYSFTAGLGSGTLALFAYYLSSPFNLLVYFVEKGSIAEFLTFLICLKLLLCSVTAYIYLRKRFSISSAGLVILAVSYSFTGYNVLQCSNIMWLDGVMVLPIIALGIYRMMREEKKQLYFWALCYSIITNWYIGYMLCLFAVLYFILEGILYHWDKNITVKEAAMKTVTFAVTSILGVMAAGVLFLPQTLFMMKEGKAFDWNIFKPAYGFSFLEGFRDLFLEPDKLTFYLSNPPVYTGSFALLLVMIFFLSKRIETKKKYLYGTFLIGMMFVFQFKPLDYIFTALRVPASHMYRYAFIFSFFMLMTAAWALKDIEKFERKEIRNAVFSLLILGTLLDYVKAYSSREKLYVSFYVILLLGIGLSFIKTKKKAGIIAVNVLLICSMMFEFVTKLGMEFEDHTQSASAYEEYNNQMEKSVAKIQKQDKGIYRMDKTFNRSAWCGNNEAMAFGYSSVAQYSSTGNVNASASLQSLGYTRDETVIPYEPVLPIDSVLGVKYIYSKTLAAGCEVVKENVLEDVNLYKNPYALPIGYAVSTEKMKENYGYEALKNHNILFSSLLGKDIQLYTEPEIVSSNTKPNVSKVWSVKVKKSGPLYGYFTYVQPYMQVYVNGSFLKKMEWYDNCVLYFGDYQEGDTVTPAVANGEGEMPEDYGMKLGTLNMETFEEAIVKLRENTCDIMEMDKGYLRAEYENNQDSTLMLTIPYEKGWEVKVNGKKTEYSQVADSFIGIELPSGKSMIEMKYHVPGMKMGIILSLTAVLLFYGWEHMRKKYQL